MPLVLPPALENVTGALVKMLATVTGKHVGDGDAPVELTADQPYAIVYEIPGGYSEGDLVMPDATVYPVFQVTSIGETRRQAGWMRDRCHQAILGRATAGGFTNSINSYDLNGVTKSLATEAELKVCDRTHDSTGGITREGLVFNAVERYELWVMPA